MVLAGTISGLSPANGPTIGSNSVTISGTNLGSGTDITSVLFGTAAAAISSQTATAVVVTVPAGTAGQVAVTVRSTSRGEVTLNNAYLYNARMNFSASFLYMRSHVMCFAAGSVTSLTPNNGPVAGTNIVTISGTNLGSGTDITAVLFGNTAAEVRTQTNNNAVVTVPPGAAGPATVTIRSTSRGEAVLSNAYTYNAGTPTHCA